ncbi:hypothetical protein BZA05DRAFT_406672 [Tricharina praecox]|uniref:uncharacterized protein n=1 Tax=Tricharina praecox TaxID=43433 RepID=UPI00221EEC6A|nr:uncharacterized protein BZA05DRAFT_406672 [Tricharina praecox]KAI5846804.1 hypothetical protein BZA05DRAFT_406672 [Tricharina praecox]
MGWDRSVGPAKSLYEFIAASILSEKLPLPSPCPNTFEGSRAIKYQGTIEVRTLSLADRYFNALKWNKWLFDRGVDVCRPSRGILRHQRFWPDHWSRPCPRARYTVCQVLSWTFVLFPCLTAAYISYTTPTVALGCRSANHLLYALLSLLVALLRVPRAFISATKRPLLARAAAAAHTTLLWTNVLIVLIGGTILQLVGAYRTCLCAGGIFAGPDTTFNLGTNSEEHQDWARAVWLNVGYLAYGWIVGVALVALVARLWISYELREALDI